ncbi:MAG: antibiotic biosynthesis monooxygenase [Oscillochloris sp.]|nr:antibiotic biosynthesis monooxygenase [Oscillochloris sp.]
MYVTARTIQTLPGQRPAFIDAWVSAAAHPLKHQPGFKHVYVMAAPDQTDAVIIFFVWEEPAHMQLWLGSEANQRVNARVSRFWLADSAATNYTLFFEQCACSHHFNADAIEEEADSCSPGVND